MCESKHNNLRRNGGRFSFSYLSDKKLIEIKTSVRTVQAPTGMIFKYYSAWTLCLSNYKRELEIA